MATRLVLAPLSMIATAAVMAVHVTPPAKPFVDVPPVIVTQAPYQQKGDLILFLNAMAFRESNNNMSVINRYGYMGKYQFSRATLRSLGPQFQIPRSRFLNNAELQDRAMIEYLKQNKRYLQDIIDRYDGAWYDGRYVTESGILAGAHLLGPLSVKAYFEPAFRSSARYRFRTQDANGTNVREYLSTFSGYSLRELD